MNDRVNQISKWSLFKAEREQIIDRYINLRRKIAFLKNIIILRLANQWLNIVKLKLKKGRKKEKIHLVRVFLSIKFIKMWKLKQRRRGGIHDILKRNI
jgi:hypothetical protein